MKHVQRPRGSSYDVCVVSAPANMYHRSKTIILESTILTFNSSDIIHTLFDKGIEEVRTSGTHPGLFDYDRYTLVDKLLRNSAYLTLNFPLPDPLKTNLQADPERANKMKIKFFADFKCFIDKIRKYNSENEYRRINFWSSIICQRQDTKSFKKVEKKDGAIVITTPFGYSWLMPARSSGRSR